MIFKPIIQSLRRRFRVFVKSKENHPANRTWIRIKHKFSISQFAQKTTFRGGLFSPRPIVEIIICLSYNSGMNARAELGDCPTRIPMMVFNEHRGYPNHVKEILAWIGENRPEFDNLVSSLDAVITDFNALDPAEVPDFYQNFHLVKEVAEGVPLPTIYVRDEGLVDKGRNHPGENGVWLPHLYSRTLIRIGMMMKRGDQKAEGPTIGYQNTPTDIRNLVIASIFQVYEELVKALPEFKGKQFEADRIIEALMEVSTQDPELTLFKPLASREGMNWVDKNDRFSIRFRQANGFT